MFSHFPLGYGVGLVSSDGEGGIHSPTTIIGGNEEGNNEEHTSIDGGLQAIVQEPSAPTPASIVEPTVEPTTEPTTEPTIVLLEQAHHIVPTTMGYCN